MSLLGHPANSCSIFRFIFAGTAIPSTSVWAVAHVRVCSLIDSGTTAWNLPPACSNGPRRAPVNIRTSGYDGGDCCPSTCIWSDNNHCPTDNRLCGDPFAVDFAFPGYENCTGYLPGMGDGLCQEDNNNADCGYDGGDVSLLNDLSGTMFLCRNQVILAVPLSHDQPWSSSHTGLPEEYYKTKEACSLCRLRRMCFSCGQERRTIGKMA